MAFRHWTPSSSGHWWLAEENFQGTAHGRGTQIWPGYLLQQLEFITQNAIKAKEHHIEEKLPEFVSVHTRDETTQSQPHTTLMAESKEELKSLFMKMKEEWKSWP